MSDGKRLEGHHQSQGHQADPMPQQCQLYLLPYPVPYHHLRHYLRIVTLLPLQLGLSPPAQPLQPNGSLVLLHLIVLPWAPARQSVIAVLHLSYLIHQRMMMMMMMRAR